MARQALVQREIVELHDFFQRWFRGEIPDQPSSFARFDQALAAGFEIVTPQGQALSRKRIIEAVRAGHGGEPDAEIWIDDARLIAEEGQLIVAAYKEWQRRGGETRGRQSTAVFREDPSAPSGLRWLWVHETWLPESDPEESAPQ